MVTARESAFRRRGVSGGFARTFGFFGGVCVPLIVGGLGGCAGGSQVSDLGPQEAIRVALDSEEQANRRAAALEIVGDQARDGEFESAEMRATLKKIAWARSNPPQVRNAAIDALLADESNIEDTRAMLRLMLPTESGAWQWDVIEHIGEIAAARGWTDLTPAFVASWSRSIPSIPSERRVEKAALEKLHPGRALDEIAFAVFAGEFDESETRSEEVVRMFDEQRRAAWGVLCDLHAVDPSARRGMTRVSERKSTSETTAAVLSFISSTPERSDEPREMALLRRCAREFGTAPITREQLAWLERLSTDEQAGLWNEAARIVSGLAPAQREGFGLRHLSAVHWASRNESRWLSMNTTELLEALEEALRGESHFRGGAMSKYDGTVRKARESVVWGDALLMLIARRAMDDERVVAELFAQADRDTLDTSTEYGGVLDVRDGGGFAALLYPPRPLQRMGDQRFVASPDLIEAGTGALFHYHFHANSKTNSQYAGPSVDDLEYARTFGRTCLVFTFIDGDRLNADSYTPDGVTIDLGTITRP